MAANTTKTKGWCWVEFPANLERFVRCWCMINVAPTEHKAYYIYTKRMWGSNRGLWKIGFPSKTNREIKKVAFRSPSHAKAFKETLFWTVLKVA